MLLHHGTIHSGIFHRKGNMMLHHLAGTTKQVANLGSKPLIGSAGPGKFDNIRGYPSILGSKYTLMYFIL